MRDKAGSGGALHSATRGERPRRARPRQRRRSIPMPCSNFRVAGCTTPESNVWRRQAAPPNASPLSRRGQATENFVARFDERRDRGPLNGTGSHRQATSNSRCGTSVLGELYAAGWGLRQQEWRGDGVGGADPAADAARLAQDARFVPMPPRCIYGCTNSLSSTFSNERASTISTSIIFLPSRLTVTRLGIIRPPTS